MNIVFTPSGSSEEPSKSLSLKDEDDIGATESGQTQTPASDFSTALAAQASADTPQERQDLPPETASESAEPLAGTALKSPRTELLSEDDQTSSALSRTAMGFDSTDPNMSINRLALSMADLALEGAQNPGGELDVEAGLVQVVDEVGLVPAVDEVGLLQAGDEMGLVRAQDAEASVRTMGQRVTANIAAEIAVTQSEQVQEPRNTGAASVARELGAELAETVNSVNASTGLRARPGLAINENYVSTAPGGQMLPTPTIALGTGVSPLVNAAVATSDASLAMAAPLTTSSATTPVATVTIPLDVSLASTDRVPQGLWDNVVGQRMSQMVRQGAQEVQLQLDPPELGRLGIRISMTGEEASVQFSSQHSGVRDLLEDNVTRLRDMLSREGVDLVNVDIGGDNNAPEDANTDDDKMNPSAQSESTVPVGGAPAPMRSDGLVDYYA